MRDFGYLERRQAPCRSVAAISCNDLGALGSEGCRPGCSASRGRACGLPSYAEGESSSSVCGALLSSRQVRLTRSARWSLSSAVAEPSPMAGCQLHSSLLVDARSSRSCCSLPVAIRVYFLAVRLQGRAAWPGRPVGLADVRTCRHASSVGAPGAPVSRMATTDGAMGIRADALGHASVRGPAAA